MIFNTFIYEIFSLYVSAINTGLIHLQALKCLVLQSAVSGPVFPQILQFSQLRSVFCLVSGHLQH